jgi:hypothetical protein
MITLFLSQQILSILSILHMKSFRNNIFNLLDILHFYKYLNWISGYLCFYLFYNYNNYSLSNIFLIFIIQFCWFVYTSNITITILQCKQIQNYKTINKNCYQEYNLIISGIFQLIIWSIILYNYVSTRIQRINDYNTRKLLYKNLLKIYIIICTIYLLISDFFIDILISHNILQDDIEKYSFMNRHIYVKFNKFYIP